MHAAVETSVLLRTGEEGRNERARGVKLVALVRSIHAHAAPATEGRVDGLVLGPPCLGRLKERARPLCAQLGLRLHLVAHICGEGRKGVHFRS